MTNILATRYNDYDSDRLPLEFGVRWDTTATSPALTRLGDAASLTVNTGVTPHTSDFSSYLPWSGMKRCALNSIGGDIFAMGGDLDDDGSATLFYGTSSKIMVQIPKFWVKFVTGSTNYDYYISPYPMKSYRLHPAFVRNGVVVDNVYVGAFEGDISSSYMYSRANVTPTVSSARATLRTAAQLWNPSTVAGYGWTLLEYNVYNAIQLLYLIEYANLDSQAQIGEGLMHIAAVQTTGYTLGATLGGPGGTNLGSGSGQVNIAGNDYAMSYRGIENLWGNTWTILDGMNIVAITVAAALTSNAAIGDDHIHCTAKTTGVIDGAPIVIKATSGQEAMTVLSHTADLITFTGTLAANYTTANGAYWSQGRPYINYGATVNAAASTYYLAAYRILPAASDWMKTPTFSSAWREGCQFSPYVGGGTDNAKYMCDYYAMVDYSVDRVPRVGGAYDTGTGLQGGLFALDSTFAGATLAANTGSRIQFVPYDYMGYHRY